jgi:hypothetical protein
MDSTLTFNYEHESQISSRFSKMMNDRRMALEAKRNQEK